MTTQDEHAYDLFISYNDADLAWVEGYLLDALDAAEIKYHSEETFALGVPRLLEFERAIKESKRTLLVLSQAYLSDNMGEFVRALTQGFGANAAIWPVIPLILQRVELPTRLAMLESLDGTDPEKWEAIVERLCAQLERPVPTMPPKPSCPYPGMVPFGEAESDRFYGRDREIQELVEQLRLHAFTAVIGASGSGKSSLVFAGLVPALRRSKLFGAGGWLVRSLRPGAIPCEPLAEALGGDPFTPAETVSALLQSETDASRLLVVIDQFEETFTVAGEDAECFQEAILALTQVAYCYVVLTVRADFYAELMGSPLWGEIRSHRFEILPMDQDSLRQAILLPAEHVGVYIETALIERLVADAAGEPGILPLIQETLVLLWERLERRYLPLRVYEALVLPSSAYDSFPGQAERTGLQVAMARRADATLADLPAEGQDTARRILLRLVQFGQGRSDTRRQQPVESLRALHDNPDLFSSTLDHLVDNRLLTISGQEGEQGRRVDIAHESLITGWPTLQMWIAERREAEETRRRLESKAAEWIRLDRKGGILEEIELLEAERWLASPDAAALGYDQTLPELVRASRNTLEAAEREREEARQRELETARRLAEEAARREEIQREANTRLRKGAQRLIAVTVVAVVLAIAGFYLYRVANRTGKIAQSQALAAHAQSYADSDAQTSLQLALTAIDIERTVLAENALRQALLATYNWQTLSGHEDEVRGLAWSPDGSRIASASFDNTIRIWQAGTNKMVTTLIGHSDAVRGIAWSPDGRKLATAAFDKTVRVWDVAAVSTTQIRQSIVLSGHVASAYSVAWSPDSTMLASTSSDGTLRLWDTQSGANVITLNEGTGEVNQAAWSPDGQRLAYAADDRTVRIWPVKALVSLPDTLNQITNTFVLTDASSLIGGTVVLTGHQDFVMSVAWSPDGTHLASASADGTIRLWRATGGPSVNTLVGHRGGWVYSVAWSPDGQRVVSASDDTTVRVWDVSTGESLDVLTGHTDWAYDARWSPNGSVLASASRDKTIRLWNLNHPSVTVLPAHGGEVKDVAWSADGGWLISGGDDRRLLSWYVGADYGLTELSTHPERIWSVAWQPRGDRLAFLGRYGTVGLWDAGRVITFTAHVQQSNRLAWSPDGQHLATVSSREGLRLWHIPSVYNGTEEGVDPQDPEDVPDIDQEGIMSVAWHPDGKMLATGYVDGAIRLWDAEGETLSARATLAGHTGFVWSLAWNPKGTMLASASQDATMRVWDTRDLSKDPMVFQEHERAVNDVSWSPDGTMLATASDDATVRLWTTKHPLSVGILSGPSKGIWSVAWTPDGRQLAAAVMDGTVWVFYTQYEDILEIARAQNVAPLTRAELSTYLPKQ